MTSKYKITSILLAIVLVLSSSRVAIGFDNRLSTPLPGHPGEPVHETITQQALAFLKTDVLADIVSNNIQTDVLHLVNSTYHFDNCTFEGSASKINDLYEQVLNSVGPSSSNQGDAREAYGSLIHIVQDFYAHSNWIESGRRDLVDDQLGFWSVTNPNFSGLVSGVVEYGFPKACAFGSPPHDDLNKDFTARPLFQEARTSAVVQTTHEWCRLVSLVRSRWDEQGVDSLFTNWVQPGSELKAAAACNDEADLSLTISDSPDPVSNGGVLTYRLAVTNDGPKDASGVKVIDSLASSVSFVQAIPSQGACTENGGTVTCTVGRVRNGQSATIDIIVRTATASRIANSARVEGRVVDPKPGNNTALATTNSPPSLVFTSDRSGRFQLWKSEPKASAPATQLTFSGAGNQESRSPDWSKQDRISYQFGASGVRGIHAIKPDGSADVQITTFLEDERDPSWSPDGRFIAYARLVGGGNYDIWIHDTQRPTGDPLANYALIGVTPSSIELRPTWSPDGTKIAFTTTAAPSPPSAAAGDAEIAVVNVRLNPVTNQIELANQSVTFLTDNTFVDLDPTWSPDSEYIAFSSTRSGAVDIYRMSAKDGEADLTNLVRLTTHDAADRNPAWSPDNRSIAFVSERDGNREIYVMSASLGEVDRDNLVQVTNDPLSNPASDEDPAWEPVVGSTAPQVPPSLRVQVSIDTVVAGTNNPTRGTVTVTDGSGQRVEGAIVTIQGPLSALPAGSGLFLSPLAGVANQDGVFAFDAREPTLGISTSSQFAVLATAQLNGKPVTTALNHTIEIGGGAIPPPGPPGALTPQQRLPLGMVFTYQQKAHFAQMVEIEKYAAYKHLMWSSTPSGGVLLALKGVWAPTGLAYHQYLATRYLRLANDPPDPDFTAIAIPSLRTPSSVPPGGMLSSTSVHLLNRNLASKAILEAYLTALQSSADRYITALSAGDTTSAGRQRNAILAYSDALVHLYEADGQITESLRTSLQLDGIVDVTVSHDDVRALQSEIAANDFSESVLQILQQMNVSDSEVQTLREQFVRADPLLVATSLFDQMAADAATARTASAGIQVGVPTSGSTDLTLSLSESSDPIGLGDDLSYTFTISNSGPSSASNVQLSNIIPAGTNFISLSTTSGECNHTAGIVTCNFGTLTAASPANSVTSVVRVRPANTGPLTNTVAVRADQADPNGTNNTATVITTVVATLPPDLSVIKSHTGDLVVGTNGVYTLTVSNAAGAGATTGTLTLTDTLPGGLSFVSGTGTGWTCQAVGQDVTCTNLGPLAPGASSAITLTVAVASAAVPSVTNTATVSTPGETNTANNTASDTATAVQVDPDLSLTKSHTGSFTAGAPGTYIIAVANATSAGPTTGPISVTDTLPAGLSFVSGSGSGWSCQVVGQDVTCTNPGPLAPGATSTLTLTVDVAAAAVPSVTNTATISTLGETNIANNSASDSTTVNPPAPDLSLSKGHVGGFTVGQNGTYTLTVANTSNAGSTIGSIAVTDTLPTGLSYVSGVGNGWTCLAAGQDVTCTNAGPLAPGASSEITLTVGVGADAVPGVTNTATVSTAGETNTGNNTASDLTAVSPRPSDLSLTKTHTGAFTVGQNGVYTLTVTNAASAGSTTGIIRIVDTLPDGLTFLAATADGWSCEANGQTVTCTNPGPLAPGASSQLSLAVTVAGAAAPSVTNTATVSTSGETNTANNTAADLTDVESLAADLSLTKTHTGDFVVGQNGVYTLTVSNAAAAAPTSGAITVTDALPNGLTFVSASGSGWSCSANGQTVTCTHQGPLAAGGSSSIELSVGVTAAAVPSVTNTATVSTAGEVNTANNSVNDPTTVRDLPPDLSMTKSHTGDFTVGAEGLYSLVIRNAASAGPTTGPITVTDTLPTGLTYVPAVPNPSASWTCSANGQTVTCTVSEALKSGATVTISISVSVAPAAVPSVTNRACVQSPGDANSANDCDDDPTTVKPSVAPPDLSLTKSHSGDFVVGTNGIYGLKVSNAATAGQSTGPTTITDTLPAGLSFVSGTGTGWSCQVSGQVVTCATSNSIAPSVSSSVTLTVGVGPAAAPSVTNTATVETSGETNTANNSASDLTTVVTGQTACTLYGADGAQGNPSRLYILNPANGATVSTVGPIGFAITGLAVHPTSGVLYGSTSNASATSPGSLVRIDRATGVGTLIGSFGFSGQTMADLAFDGSGQLYGWLEGADDDLYTINLTTGAATLIGDSGLTTSGSGLEFTPSGTLLQTGAGDRGEMFTINPATGTVVTSVILNGTTGRMIAALTIDASGTVFGARLAGGGGTATAELVTINPSSGAVDVRGPTVNRLDAIAFACQEPPKPDLSLTKTHAGAFTVGQNGTYTLTVTNAQSAGPTTGPLSLTDTLPNGLSFVSGTGSGWACQANGQQVSCTNPGPLAPGGSSQVVLSVAVGATAVPSVTNTASVNTSGETSTGDNSANDLTIVDAAVVPPDLSIAKSHTDSFIVGENGRYTVTVSNSASAGPTTGAITVTDTLPAGLTYVPAGTALPPDWTCQAGDQTVTCTYAKTLPAGASISFPLVVQVGSAALPSITNTVSVSTPGETNTADNGTSDLTTVAMSTPTPTATPTVTQTSTPTRTATATSPSTATSTATASTTLTPTPTRTPTATATPMGTVTPKATGTPTSTKTPTATVPSTKTPTPTSTPVIPPQTNCELYPIALHVRALAGRSIGATITDSSNNYDDLVRPRWLTWTGDRSSAALARSLTPPGDSHTYINPNNPNDRVVSVGDWVQGTSDRAVDGQVRTMLQSLKGREIVVPIWDDQDDRGGGHGGRSDGGRAEADDGDETGPDRGQLGRHDESGRSGQELYHVVGFARIQILEYQLWGEDRLLIRYLGSAACAGGGPPPPPTSCELYPIALHVRAVSGAQPGTVLRNVFEGTGPGQFGWLSWSGDGSAPTLARSLTPPGDSHTYVNPYNRQDRVVSIGDWVSGNTGVSDARAVRDSLDRLLQREIVVPVWDMVGSDRSGRRDDDGAATDRWGGPEVDHGGGGRIQFRVSNFARIRLLEYRLSGKSLISATYLGFDPCTNRLGMRTATQEVMRALATGGDIDQEPLTGVEDQPPVHFQYVARVMASEFVWAGTQRKTRSSRPTRRRFKNKVWVQHRRSNRRRVSRSSAGLNETV